MRDTAQTTADMLGSDDTYRMVRDRLGRLEITDGAARTIAGWWQSPGSVGSTLAALASGRPVDVTDLLDDIHATRVAHPVGLEPEDSRALDMLATWAMNGGE